MGDATTESVLTHSAPPHPQRLNALKHGCRAETLVLPREDAAEFEAWRQSAYAHYRPLTPEEDRCVERIVACEWRMERWQRWERAVHATLDDLLEEAPGGPTAQHRNPDMHYWQHRAIDCTVQEGRLERSMGRAERRLFELQRARRQGLLAPARRDGLLAPAPVEERMHPAEACPMDETALPTAAPASPSAPNGLPGHQGASVPTDAMACFDALNGFSNDQPETHNGSRLMGRSSRPPPTPQAVGTTAPPNGALRQTGRMPEGTASPGAPSPPWRLAGVPDGLSAVPLRKPQGNLLRGGG